MGRSGVNFPFDGAWPSLACCCPSYPVKGYTVTLEVNVPKAAISAEGGLYLNGKRLAPLGAGSTLKATLPPSNEERVRLELRSRGWIPQKEIPGSRDPRTLGIQMFNVTMQSEGVEGRMFIANTGQWVKK